jgi:mono/diheme cytochrome c family protein
VPLRIVYLLLPLSLYCVSLCFGESEPFAIRLMNDLACSSCHSGLQDKNNVRDKIPDLSYAGLRYNPSYLFHFLQYPERVRRHIGASRMPDFHFNRKESLAVTRFLTKQKEMPNGLPEFPSALIHSNRRNNGDVDSKTAEDLITRQFNCTVCHKLEGGGGELAVDLATVGYRLQPMWVKMMIAQPDLFHPGAKMPSQFYKIDTQQKRLEAIVPEAAQKINLITDYLVTLGEKKIDDLNRIYTRILTTNSNITAKIGQQIFRSQNCIACHHHSAVKPWARKIAPDLSLERWRVREPWLKSYLQKPTSIRPFGFYPGSGSRMPDFRLTDEEAAIISDFLVKKTEKTNPQPYDFEPGRLSAFSMAKAHTLLKDKLSCLGCHQFNHMGGRIGPDLTNLGERLLPSFVYNVIKNPGTAIPDVVMPKIEMPEKTLRLITNFLLQFQGTDDELRYLSLVDTPLQLDQETDQAEQNYAKYCSACHGVTGGGDGYNAKFLPKSPTVHSDASSMSKRPEDTLFDGIYAGGYILNKSHFMPPWGFTLSVEEIHELVRFIRQLCQCEGPVWSRDGQ